jgi:hypothetical protein
MTRLERLKRAIACELEAAVRLGRAAGERDRRRGERGRTQMNRRDPDRSCQIQGGSALKGLRNKIRVRRITRQGETAI